MSQIQFIIKRSGEKVEFDQAKITEAIWKAAQSVDGKDHDEAENLSKQVAATLETSFKDDEHPTVEQIQDTVEQVLIETGHAKTAKSYILYREKHKEERTAQQEILGGFTTTLPFTDNALQVVAKRYLRRGDDGAIMESPEMMFERIAETLANVEKMYGKTESEIDGFAKDFEKVLKNFEFIPAGRTLRNCGAETRLIPNCIVLHPEDSMTSIFGTLTDAALLQQAGSGLGFPLHLMRPAGMPTKQSRGMASGPVSFLKVYNQAFRVIKQQNRHGANMAVMRIDHPDILEFIHCKQKEGDINTFNVSVGLTNEFMEQVQSRDPKPWMCEWDGVKMKPRRIYRDSHDTLVDIKEETMSAYELFMEIINCAWSNGEPGCVFLDEVNRTNPVPGIGRIEACNPCGEQFLHDGDVCNLGAINLDKFVKDGKVDYAHLEYVAKIATRMLDNVVDLTDPPVEKVKTRFQDNRRLGIGIMGFADMLYQLNVGYNTPEGLEIAEKVMKCINDASHKASEYLAEEKGVFPNWEHSVFYKQGVKRRNAATTNIAPTGTTSMIVDVSGGVEPYFALAYYYRGILGGNTQLFYVNKHLEHALKRAGCFTDEVMEKIIAHGSLQGIDEIPEEIQKVFVTAQDISADDHIKAQAAFQKHLDNSISKTCNFPNNATKEDVLDGYVLAWSLGCKGCTVYRDGSRDFQILNLNKDKEENDQKDQDMIQRRDQFDLTAEMHKKMKTKKEVMKDRTCPECGEMVNISEGCYTCVGCGSSACSI